MSTFRVFNVALLPLDTSTTRMVGEDGYIKLFQETRAIFAESVRSRTLTESAAKLTRDAYIFPDSIQTTMRRQSRGAPEPSSPIVFGSFMKCLRTSRVDDLYTDETLFVQQDGQEPVSSRRRLRFVFDPVSHQLAVEERGGALPSTPRMLSALDRIFSQAAESHFPDYTLVVNLVSRSEALDEVLKNARGIRSVHIRLTFPNGEETDSILDELLESNAHRLDMTVSADRGAVMPSLPTQVEELLRKAPLLGDARVVYNRPTAEDSEKTVVAQYDTRQNPVRFRANKGEKEPEDGFASRVVDKLGAATRANDAPGEQ
jgi:hypothetical protein